MRKVIISDKVLEKLEQLENFLIYELMLSEEVALGKSGRMRMFLADLASPVDYSLCRFKKWRVLGYRCAIFEKSWIFAYEVFKNGGVIVRDMSHTAILTE